MQRKKVLVLQRKKSNARILLPWEMRLSSQQFGGPEKKPMMRLGMPIWRWARLEGQTGDSGMGASGVKEARSRCKAHPCIPDAPGEGTRLAWPGEHQQDLRENWSNSLP